MTSSTANIFHVTGLYAGNSAVSDESPSQRQVTRSFDAFFDLRLNQRLSKHSWGFLIETPLGSLWRHCNDACPIAKWVAEAWLHDMIPGNTPNNGHLGHFFQNVILFSNAVHYKRNILQWNHSSTMNILSTLWTLMAWCFSTRASVATVLNTHPVLKLEHKLKHVCPEKKALVSQNGMISSAWTCWCWSRCILSQLAQYNG